MWNGVYPALTTKFTANDTLDFKLIEKNLNAQLDAGVDGVILGGSLGEASVLTSEEKYDLLKFTVEKVGGKVPVVMNIAEGRTSDAVKLAQESEKLGAKSAKPRSAARRWSRIRRLRATPRGRGADPS